MTPTSKQTQNITRKRVVVNNSITSLIPHAASCWHQDATQAIFPNRTMTNSTNPFQSDAVNQQKKHVKEDTPYTVN